MTIQISMLDKIKDKEQRDEIEEMGNKFVKRVLNYGDKYKIAMLGDNARIRETK